MISMKRLVELADVISWSKSAGEIANARMEVFEGVQGILNEVKAALESDDSAHSDAILENILEKCGVKR